MRRLHANTLLVIAAAIWGFAFLFQKAAMRHVGPVQFVAARSIVACLALLPLAFAEMRVGGVKWREVGAAALPAGAVFFAAAVLQQAGLVTASVTNTGFLTALYVVVVPFIVWLLMARRPAPAVWIAVLLSFSGTWLLGGGTLGAFSLGDGLVAASASLWALHVVMTGQAGSFGRPITFTALQFLAVAILGGIAALATEPITVCGLRAAWIEIAYVGLLSSALTFTMFSVALRHTGPSEASIIVSSETLFAAFGAWLVMGERLAGVRWTGAGLIVAATLIVQLGPGKKAAELSK